MKQTLIHNVWRLIFKTFRKKRFAQFVARIQPQPHERILDIGGYPGTWEGLEQIAAEIHIVNVHEITPPADPGHFRFHVADGCALPFADHSFDIVFSNSVIEHVGDFARQQAFAAEVIRTGRRLWVQTRRRSFGSSLIS